jgi:chemotaxis protein MotD
MTLTNAVPAPKVAAPALPKAAADAKADAKGAAGQQGNEDFAGLLSRIKAAADGAAPDTDAAANVTVDGETGVQTRRTAGGRSKPLRADDVLPPEMLLTLYPQSSPPVNALPSTAALSPAALLQAAATALQGAVPADNANGPAQGGDAATKAVDAVMLAAGDTAGTATGYPATAASALSAGQQQGFANAVPQAAAPATAPGAAELAAPPALPQQQILAQAMARPEAQSPRQTASAMVQRTPEKRTDSTAPDGTKPASMTDAMALPLSAAADEPEQAPLPPAHLQETKLTVTHQETVLPGAGQLPLAQQAAERIVAALQSPDAPTTPQTTAITRDAADPAPVRILHIQLQPADLGLLTVKLALRQGGLDIQVEAAEHRTARLLEADRDRLSDLLRSAGYAVDGLSVQVTPSDKSGQAFTSFAGTGNSGQPNPQPQPGAQGDAGRGQQPHGRSDDGAGALPRSEESENAHAVRPAAGGAVYL